MMRPICHPDYRYTPWSPERRDAASIAAKRRLRASRPEPMPRNFTGVVNGVGEFIQCSDERRAALMTSLQKVISIYIERGPRGINDDDAEFLGELMNFFAQQAHVIVREVAIVLEQRTQGTVTDAHDAPRSGTGQPSNVA
jgi:hypothetical protein